MKRKRKDKEKKKKKSIHKTLSRVATPLNPPGVQARRRFFLHTKYPPLTLSNLSNYEVGVFIVYRIANLNFFDFLFQTLFVYFFCGYFWDKPAVNETFTSTYQCGTNW